MVACNYCRSSSIYFAQIIESWILVRRLALDTRSCMLCTLPKSPHVFCGLIMSIALCLRSVLYVRYKEYYILSSSFVQVPQSSNCALVTSCGLGKEFWTISANDFEFFGQTIFISDLCWIVVIFTVKYSILAFYWRLFAHVRKARKAIFILLAFVTCWTIAVVTSGSELPPTCSFLFSDLGTHDRVAMSTRQG